MEFPSKGIAFRPGISNRFNQRLNLDATQAVNGLAAKAALKGVKHFGGDDEIRHGPFSLR